MEFVLSTGQPLQTSYVIVEGEIHQVVYRVHCPLKIKAPVATIEKIVPSSESTLDMKDQFRELAKIEFNTLKPYKSKITIEGEAKIAEEIFTRGGWGWYGSDHLFTGPDGREYKWRVYMIKPTLFLNTSPKTLVAKFHRRHPHVSKESKAATLEILEEGLRMVDFILISFVFFEKLRKDMEGSL